MLISLTSVKLAIGLPNLKAKSCSLIPELCKDFTYCGLIVCAACALWSLILTSCTSAWLADRLPDHKAKSGSGCEELETEGVSLPVAALSNRLHLRRCLQLLHLNCCSRLHLFNFSDSTNHALLQLIHANIKLACVSCCLNSLVVLSFLFKFCDSAWKIFDLCLHFN